MRAILIDPITQSVNEIELAGSLEAINQEAGRSCKLAYRYLNGDVLYADKHTITGECLHLFSDDNRMINSFGKGMFVGSNFSDAISCVEQIRSSFSFRQYFPNPEPEYSPIVEVGDIITVKAPVVLKNSTGGTQRMSLPADLELTIDRVWYDYETGYRLAARITDETVIASLRSKLLSHIAPTGIGRIIPASPSSPCVLKRRS